MTIRVLTAAVCPYCGIENKFHCEFASTRYKNFRYCENDDDSQVEGGCGREFVVYASLIVKVDAAGIEGQAEVSE